MKVLAPVGRTIDSLQGDGRGRILAAVASGWGLLVGARMAYPVLLPYIRDAYGLSLSVAGLLVTVLWLGSALGQLPGGILADRFNERHVMTAGLLVVGDEPRENWAETVAAFGDRDVEVAVLTGDDERAAARFREHPAVDNVFAGVPPEAKAETVARLGGDGTTVMVGDGTNDAPALATADLGIALGGGTALAADAADVAIVTDDLATLETVFDLATAANRRIKQNIGWAFLYNGVAIPLAVAGLINPLFAALAMGTSSLLVVTNSSRPLL